MRPDSLQVESNPPDDRFQLGPTVIVELHAWRADDCGVEDAPLAEHVLPVRQADLRLELEADERQEAVEDSCGPREVSPLEGVVDADENFGPSEARHYAQRTSL